MRDIINIFEMQLAEPLTVLLLTLGAYQLAEWVFIRCGRKAFFHPLVSASLVVYLVIRFLPMELDTYREHSDILRILLAPFTVALAVPLSRHLHNLRSHAGPVLFSLLFGSFVAVAGGLALAWSAGAVPEVMLSLATKAITTAVALVVSEEIGGIVPLAVAVVCISGIFGGIIGPWLCQKSGIRDPRAVGFALGVNAHAGGTARAFEINMTMGVYASLGMCLNAILTPAVLPAVIGLFF
ncbi:MAG: LrgB family protein [Endozoicomonas sp.]